MADLDGIELGLFASRVAAMCEEMGALLGRTAFSPNIRDRKDYSCALFDAAGDLLGQATHIPVHLGSMAHAMAGLVAARDWQHGDLLISMTLTRAARTCRTSPWWRPRLRMVA